MAAASPELVVCPRLLYLCHHTAIYVSPYYYIQVSLYYCVQRLAVGTVAEVLHTQRICVHIYIYTYIYIQSCWSCCRGVASAAVAAVEELLQLPILLCPQTTATHLASADHYISIVLILLYMCPHRWHRQRQTHPLRRYSHPRPQLRLKELPQLLRKRRREEAQERWGTSSFAPYYAPAHQHTCTLC
jgi:hypothetical protein